MYRHDSSVVQAIHADRIRTEVRGPRPVSEPRSSREPRHRVRRAVGRVFVRFGAWLAAERPDSLLKPAA